MGGGTGTGGDARGSKGKGKKRSRQAQKKAEPIILEATAEEVEIKVDTVWDHHMNVVVVRGETKRKKTRKKEEKKREKNREMPLTNGLARQTQPISGVGWRVLVCSPLKMGCVAPLSGRRRL